MNGVRWTRASTMRGGIVGASLIFLPALGMLAPARAGAQWSTTYEQFYLPGTFNWEFRRSYPAADRLFNAFDYGHAILYERLYNDPEADVSILEDKEFDFITRKLLVSPPRLPLEESAIEVAYAKLVPEAKMMFDWAHLLHRQIYDVLSSEGMSQGDKDAKIAELVTYYKTRPDRAFSSVPKNMDLMEGQPYSLVFRNKYPKFNGLIWGYHWLQVGLYEPLMTGKSLDGRQAGVAAAVARFRQMLENAPEHMPRTMPMTAAVAPTFAQRYPEAAIIFDNLHAMHDVVSDILASPKVPHDRKRAEILTAASRYRDATSFAMTPKEWMDMAQMMGIENMGGPAVGFLAAWPTPTMARGMSAAEAMKTMGHGAMNMPGTPSTTSPSGVDHSKMPGMGHDSAGAKPDTARNAMPNMPGMDHSKMPGMKAADTSRSSMADMPGMKAHQMEVTASNDSAMTELHRRMMADPVIHERIMQDPVIHERVMQDPVMRRLMNEVMSSAPRPTAKAAAPKKVTPVKKPAPTAKAMDHSSMPGMVMPGDSANKKKPPIA